MKILVACEESQAVCKAFRAKGHEAYSCDIVMCSGCKALARVGYRKKVVAAVVEPV